MKAVTSSTSEAPAGRSIPEFAQQVGVGRATFYLLSPKDRPATVKIGKRTIVRESPADWLAQMAERGGVQTVKPQRAAQGPAMMAKYQPRRPSRADVARSLREVSILWAKPPDPGPEDNNGHAQVAEVGTNEQSKLPGKFTLARAKRKVTR